jgi:hypothetical protein
MKISIIATAALSLSLLFVGCANKSLKTKQSGFLKSYNNMEDMEGVDNTMVSVTQGADFSKYEYIYVEPVQVISLVSEGAKTQHQKDLYAEISQYLTDGYRTKIQNSSVYKLASSKTQANTMVFEPAVTAVEIAQDDLEWYQYTPVTLAATGIARATYVDGKVRILGEGRFVDPATNKVLMRVVSLQKGAEVSVSKDKLKFKDLKSGLDSWLNRANKTLEKIKKY